ncbi:hypothetical protein CONLIGDRAFT_579027 [Coniochaeta ligniaria NRRL 30616]|uniref:BTB domain-containing protein n=1 Tax=Coniochaeta ligniaria NRRL 30616 TaxID=1408157 RepID=A0A1J7IKJ7_9PEZI|nr:hypothetical protein CONLIGDRAFT_579027 [Coniochaeta ligniaria NRRL 30616]
MVVGDSASTTLALRGPASVAGHGHSSHSRTASSTLSSSRARRYNRSHAGGVSFVPQNEFPVFSHSGDVEILVRVASGHENRYLLHRHTLTRCSGFFEASTSDQWSRARQVPELTPPSTAGAIEAAPVSSGELARIAEGRKSSSDEGGRPLPSSLGSPRRRWRYELDPGTGDNDIPMLIQKDEPTPLTAPNIASSTSIFGGSSHNKTPTTHSNSSFFRSVANLALSSPHAAPPLPPLTQSDQDLLRDYDNLFRIMYNYPPILDGINIADAYVQCKSLLTLADQYDALPVVGPRVDHHLLQFQSRLWKQIAKYPISYLRLGYLARSKVIFQEALIHVVGQWPAGERSLRSILPDTVLDIIEDKVDELEETVSRVEARLFRLTLTTRTGERVAPHTNYLDWLAVSLFRQWLADNTTPPAAPVPDRTANGRNGAANGNRPNTRGSSSNNGAAANPHNTLTVGRAVVSVPPLASLGRTYRVLGSPAGAYLGHDECKRFLKLTPELYSRDNLRRFEKRVEEIKAIAREVVRPLMGSGLELETTSTGRGVAEGIGYLTCTVVGDRDLPWNYG